MNKEKKNFSLTNNNYTRNSGKSQISLDEIKRLNFWNYIETFGAELKKKKSSKYGRLYKTEFGSLWIRYDYSTGYFFYINLSNDTDKGTLIDFIQNNILHEKNLGKVKRYIIDHINLF